MQETVFKQTEGYVKLRGIINGLSNPPNNFGVREGKSKGSGKAWKSVKFNIKTTNSNNVTVELFGMTKDKAIFYNKNIKQSRKVPWEQRHIYKEKEFELILPEFDLVEKIAEDFKDGDSVFIIGKLDFSEYLNVKTGKKVLQNSIIIKSINKTTEPINFAKEDFEETNEFEQELIIKEVFSDENNTVVTGFVVKYGGVLQDCVFEVNPENKTLCENFSKLSIGDYIKVVGQIYNKYEVITEMVDTNGWGDPIENKTTRRLKSLQIQKAYGAEIISSMYSEKEILEQINKQNEKKLETNPDFNPEELDELDLDLD